jgi:hypothetical protein
MAMSSTDYKGTWQGAMVNIDISERISVNGKSHQTIKESKTLDFGFGTSDDKLSDIGCGDGFTPVPGPKGDPGPQGPPGIQGKDGFVGKDGKDGKSAYELAKENGFEGSEGEWLQSLRADRSIYEPYKSYFEFPNVGDKGTFYVDTSENSTYRWDDNDKRYYCIGTNYKDIEEIDGGQA